MEYLKHIELAIEYIESNMREKLTVSSCAKACGYSEYHFLRIFRLVTGYTPMDYVRKRRLSEAAKELLGSSRPIIDIALSWGFDSMDSFTFVETIHDTWNYIYSKWMPESSYIRSLGPDFECYCEESRTYSEQIYIPIKNKMEDVVK